MAYIANKPVRFNRDYAVGERIPDEVIDPKMVKRLLEWGKIIKIDFPVSDAPPTGDDDPDTADGGGNPDMADGNGNDNPKNENDIPENDSDTPENENEDAQDEDGTDGEGVESTEDALDGDDSINTPSAEETPETANGEATGDPDAPATNSALTCPICQKVFGLKSALTQHINKIHGKN